MRPSFSHQSSHIAFDCIDLQDRHVSLCFDTKPAPSHGFTSARTIVIRMSSAIVPIVLCVANVCSIASADTAASSVSGSGLVSSKSAHRQGSNDDECPVRLSHSVDESNNQTEERHQWSGSCVCNSVLREIHCHGLERVPQFVGPAHQESHRRVPQVTWNAVYMSRQAISELKTGAFGRLRTARLVLNFNPIDNRIEHRPLRGLETVLEELQLGACRLRLLPSSLLSGMDKLERLHLWGNQIQQFPVGFFRQASNLRELLLWDNEIAVLNGDTLAGLWNLRRLDLDKNKIDELRKEAFRHLPELESLRLANNKIQSLTEKPFLYVNNLRALNLAGNRIEYVSSGAFEGLDRLVSLALNDNRISLIPDNLFSSMENLTQLLLHNNSIQYVWPRTFAGLRSLTRLQLASNRLGQLPDGMLRQSPHLRHLDLDGNQLKTIGRCAFPMPPRRTAQTATVAPPRASPSRGGGARTSSATSGPAATVAPAEVGGSRMKFLSLIGNPMICECQLTWLLEFQQQTMGSSDSSPLPWGPLWPTVRGTCQESRQADVAPESHIHHSSSPFSDTDAVGGSSKSSQVAAAAAAEWTRSMSVELSHAADRGVSSIVGRCSQLVSSCAEKQLQKTTDCHYE